MNGYVNKQTIIRKLNKFAIDCLKEDQLERYTAYSTAACAIAMTKSADVQPVKRGHWIDIYEYCKMNGYRPSGVAVYYWCSECMKEEKKTSDFCPNCGADMREKEGAEGNE